MKPLGGGGLASYMGVRSDLEDNDEGLRGQALLLPFPLLSCSSSLSSPSSLCGPCTNESSQAHISMWRPEEDIRVLPPLFSSLYLEARPFTAPDAFCFG